MTSKSKQRRMVSAVAAFSLVLAACSSGDGDDAAGDTIAAPAETASPSTEAPATDAPGTTAASAPDSTEESTGGSTAPAPTEPSATDAPVVVPEILQFSAPLVGGGTFEGAAVADKPTAFWFWAPT